MDRDVRHGTYRLALAIKKWLGPQVARTLFTSGSRITIVARVNPPRNPAGEYELRFLRAAPIHSRVVGTYRSESGTNVDPARRDGSSEIPSESPAN